MPSATSLSSRSRGHGTGVLRSLASPSRAVLSAAAPRLTMMTDAIALVTSKAVAVARATTIICHVRSQMGGGTRYPAQARGPEPVGSAETTSVPGPIRDSVVTLWWLRPARSSVLLTSGRHSGGKPALRPGRAPPPPPPPPPAPAPVPAPPPAPPTPCVRCAPARSPSFPFL